MNRVDRRLALVTGASSGIGRAFADRLAGDGYDLVVVARREERLRRLKDELERAHEVSVRPLVADLSTEHGLESAVAAAADPAIRMLVDCAGLGHYMPFVDLPPETADELVKLSVLAPVMIIRAALPGMVKRGDGAVISVSSLLAVSGGVDVAILPKRAVYAGSKAFMLTFMQLLAVELKETGVRAVVVCPGQVKTEFHSRQGIDLSQSPRMEPEDVVRASLVALAQGEVICVPALEDRALLEEHARAEMNLMMVGRNAVLADRYTK
ncbi:MAG TPA: SDR family NAD(P)-dependent oxidoreductase [Candidatus Dormibacteraeota bacterium]